MPSSRRPPSHSPLAGPGPSSGPERQQMFNYQKYFDSCCKNNGLALKLSYDMPPGYETANASFDPSAKTVYINKAMLADVPDFEKAFYLFHELRHAMQYVCPEQFNELIIRSKEYVIMYDGSCYRAVNNEWKMCKLDGGEEFFTDIYLAQPYEVDANSFAYEQTKLLFGDLDTLRDLYSFWLPKKHISNQTFTELYSLIDKKIHSSS